MSSIFFYISAAFYLFAAIPVFKLSISFYLPYAISFDKPIDLVKFN